MSINWLERLQDEIPKTPDRGAAKTAKSGVSAATAAGHPVISQKNMASGDSPANPESREAGGPTTPLSSGSEAFSLIDLEKVRQTREASEKRRAKRRQTVVDLAAEDGWTRDIYIGEPDRSYRDVVVIPSLKRDDGEFFYFEQEIPIEKWDEWKFLELVAGIQCQK